MCAGSPLTVMRPSRISCSMSRREPMPACASTLCSLGASGSGASTRLRAAPRPRLGASALAVVARPTAPRRTGLAGLDRRRTLGTASASVARGRARRASTVSAGIGGVVAGAPVASAPDRSPSAAFGARRSPRSRAARAGGCAVAASPRRLRRRPRRALSPALAASRASAPCDGASAARGRVVRRVAAARRARRGRLRASECAASAPPLGDVVVGGRLASSDRVHGWVPGRASVAARGGSVGRSMGSAGAGCGLRRRRLAASASDGRRPAPLSRSAERCSASACDHGARAPAGRRAPAAGRGCQAEVVEELARRGVQRRTARRFAVADGLDPAAVLELLDDRAADGDAADVFDVAARHRLAVGDDRQRLHHGARVLRRLLGVQAVEVVAHLGPALEAPAGGQRHQLDAAAFPVAHQLVEQRARACRCRSGRRTARACRAAAAAAARR